MICTNCNRDLNAIGSDNMYHVAGYPLCESCNETTDMEEFELDCVFDRAMMDYEDAPPEYNWWDDRTYTTD